MQIDWNLALTIGAGALGARLAYDAIVAALAGIVAMIAWATDR